MAIYPIQSAAVRDSRASTRPSALGGSQKRSVSRPENLSLLRQTSQAATRIREVFSGVRSSNAPEQTDAASASWQPIYDVKARYVSRDVYEQREIRETQDVFEDRAITEERTVHGERDIYEERALYEARPVYAKQAMLETHVHGTRDIDHYAKTRAAGIDGGADFAVTVGDSETAEVKFVGNKKIAVTVSGETKDFAFDGTASSFSAGLLEALNSITDVSTDYTSDGKLHLRTSKGQSLTISELTNGRRDKSESPLDELGLIAGTTKASVAGYREVQVGTEQVLVGAERVKTGSERYVAGMETVLIGTARVKVGEKQVVVGTENVKVGSERTIGAYDRTLVGFKQLPGAKGHAPEGSVRFNMGPRTPAGLVGLLFGKLPQPSMALGTILSAYDVS